VHETDRSHLPCSLMKNDIIGLLSCDIYLFICILCQVIPPLRFSDTLQIGPKLYRHGGSFQVLFFLFVFLLTHAVGVGDGWLVLIGKVGLVDLHGNPVVTMVNYGKPPHHTCSLW